MHTTAIQGGKKVHSLGKLLALSDVLDFGSSSVNSGIHPFLPNLAILLATFLARPDFRTAAMQVDNS